MYQQLVPVTHHFYPLQRHTDANEPPFTDFLRKLHTDASPFPENLIYLHIPYCEKHCLFCPFHVRVSRDEHLFERYVRALEREIEFVSRFPYVSGTTFSAVYFGGGSPSLLSMAHLERLFTALRTRFRLSTDAEWTFEGEPHGLSDRALLSFLADQGTQRLSYGVQTFDKKLRETLHIAATLEHVHDCLEGARLHRFEEVNIDMMFHLPGQTMADLDRDLQEIADAGFDSVDYYYMSYFGLPKRVFLDMEKGTFPKRPSEEVRIEMNRRIRERMREMAYHHVTDHVFAKRETGSDYYRLLWGGGFGEHRAQTLAIGASARGFLAGHSYANTLAHDAYVERIERGELPIFKVSDPLADECNRGLVFFPKFFRLDTRNTPPNERTAKKLHRLLDAGLARRDSDTIVLTDEAKDWIPNITVDLFEEEQRVIHDQWVDALHSRFSNRVTL